MSPNLIFALKLGLRVLGDRLFEVLSDRGIGIFRRCLIGNWELGIGEWVIGNR
ncbi:MAG: hypothetical protein KME31_23435 [Tolypothrix carrinoi HA7290-LM1]|nr:hypothetical protein [Tolypothrix carrinoi HA7290-LM1]